ncbi:MAG: TolC family protein [Sedimentisphaerales bacterium]|jgi:outer membrane protein TolC
MDKRQPTFAVCAVTAIVLTMVVGCSPDFHKADADKEVYKIIDSKWRDNFGQKANYVISDANTISTPNDVNVAKAPIFEEPLTLAQAVAIATKYNRDYQTQKENLYLSALSLTGERYKYALKWFGTIDYEYSKNGENPENQTIKSEAGVSKTFLTPEGILLNSSLAIDWVRFLTGAPRTTLGSVLSGTFDVPLLGSGGGKVAWESLTQAERNVLYQIRTFNRYRQTFVVDIISNYYGVLQQKDSVNNAYSNWKSSIEYRKQAELEAKTGRTPAYQVDQARQRELSAYDSYVTNLQSYEQFLDAFKVRLTLPVNATLELDQNELIALRNVATGEPNVTVDAAINIAILCRLDLVNSYDSVEDAQRKVKLASEGLGVQLNLTGSANVNSEPDKNFDNLQFHKGNYTFGASADLPFDRKNQRNAYRQALITLEQQQREYSNDLDLVMLGVRQAYRQYMATAEQYITQKKSLALAEDRVKNMPVLLKSGRAQTRDLLDAQDALLQAQNSLTSALIGHTIAKLNFFRDVGILQVKPDGMWTQSKTEVSRNQTNEREQSKQSSEDNL